VCADGYDLSPPWFPQGESQTWDIILKGQLALPATTSQRLKSNQIWTYKLHMFV